MMTRFEPFALQLFRRHRRGESIEELAAGLGIPEERVRQRLHVATLYYERQSTQESLLVLAGELAGVG